MGTSQQNKAILVLVLLFLASIQMFAADWDGEPPSMKSFAKPDYQKWLPNEQPSPQTAQKLNELGFDAYVAENLVEAAQLWKAALLMDPEHYLAHYNYAAVLSIFANGFGDFDARADEIPYSTWEKEDFSLYRVEIIFHLKKSISLRPSRMDRLKNDEDFDSIRNLEAYRNVLMGPNPTIEDILREAPQWHSLQTGAYLPKDTITFNTERTMRFVWDKEQLKAFPEVYEVTADKSFSGTWDIDGQYVVITTGAGERVLCKNLHHYDDMGFIKKRILGFQGVWYGDYDAHFWEGQDA